MYIPSLSSSLSSSTFDLRRASYVFKHTRFALKRGTSDFGPVTFANKFVSKFINVL